MEMNLQDDHECRLVSIDYNVKRMMGSSKMTFLPAAAQTPLKCAVGRSDNLLISLPFNFLFLAPQKKKKKKKETFFDVFQK